MLNNKVAEAAVKCAVKRAQKHNSVAVGVEHLRQWIVEMGYYGNTLDELLAEYSKHFDKVCKNCTHSFFDDNHDRMCKNIDSDHAADWVQDDGSCDGWAIE